MCCYSPTALTFGPSELDVLYATGRSLPDAFRNVKSVDNT